MKISEYDLVLVPSYRQRNDLAKSLASSTTQGNLGTSVETFPSLAKDLWELYGNGTTPISQIDRKLFLAKAFLSQPQDEDGTFELDGDSLMRVAEKLVTSLAGRPGAMEAIISALQVGTLHQREEAMLRVVSDYYLLLRQTGFIEHNDALSTLSANDLAMSEYKAVKVQGFPSLTPQQEHFLGNLHGMVTIEGSSQEKAHMQKIPSDIELRFAFSSGEYGTPHALLQEISELVAEGNQSIMLVTPRPDQLCNKLEGALAKAQIACQVHRKTAFNDTEFGCWVVSALKTLEHPCPSKQRITDCLLSPFSGASTRAAHAFDATMRGDRLEDPDTSKANLFFQSETVLKLSGINDVDSLKAFHETAADTIDKIKGQPFAWKQRQRASLAAFTNIMGRCFQLGLPKQTAITVLEAITLLTTAKQSPEDPIASVTICSPSNAREFATRSFDSTIVADLTNDCYPVTTKEDPADMLLDKLGLGMNRDRIDEARKDFLAITETASYALSLHRKLYDYDGEEAVPAMVLDELIDEYRPDVTATSDIDNVYRLPPILQANLSLSNEGRFAESFESDLELPPATRETAYENDPVLTGENLNTLIEKLTPFPGKGIHLSPSRVETYLDCPYRWFIENQVKPESIDEQFSPLEKGVYVHDILHKFYQEFQSQTGEPKVTEHNLEQAREILGKVIDNVSDAQEFLIPKSGRYVPVNMFEEQMRDNQNDMIMDMLDFEAQLLPTFSPTHFEYEIPREEAVEYAGVKIYGKIDRIDVDQRGRAVIIDYKGSIKTSHTLDAYFNGSGRVQTMIYAQAVRKHLGLDIVGALYVSTGKKREMAGAVDGKVIESPHLPNLKGGSMLTDVCSFHDLLDQVEQDVAEKLSPLFQGKIPRTKNDNCKYCDYSACPKSR